MTSGGMTSGPQEVPGGGRDGRLLGVSLLIGGIAWPVATLLTPFLLLLLYVLLMVWSGASTDTDVGASADLPVLVTIAIIGGVVVIGALLAGIVMDVLSIVLASRRLVAHPGDRLLPLLALIATAGAIVVSVILVVMTVTRSMSTPEAVQDIRAAIDGTLAGAALLLRLAQIVLGIIRLIAGGRRG